jgi:dTDP-glucose pyrophosphorylase
MIGLVLAAGSGRRPRPYTDTLPKALVPIDSETTVLDLTPASGLTTEQLAVLRARLVA